MSRTRIVKGNITKIIGGNYRMFAKEDIEFHSNQKVIHNAKEGTFYDNPAPAPKLQYDDEPDFDIELELIKDDFVPLGIPNYKGEPENDKIKFKLIIEGAGVNQWHLSIKSKDQLIYELFSGSGEIEGVVIKGKKKKDSQSPPKEIDDVKSTPIQRFWPKGEYIISWDGFDINNIYDSALMKSENGLIVSIIGQAEFKKKSFAIEKPIKFTHKEVDWVDVRIDSNNFKIDTTLRVNLKDGGENGLQCRNRDIDPDPKMRVSMKECDWDKIPSTSIVAGKPIIKSRTKSFTDLEKLAIDGLNYHWGRNNNHAEAKDVKIADDSYEVYINAVNTTEKTMDDVSLVYNTNSKWMRSGNPGAATLNPVSWMGNLISREAVCYNVGYIKFSNGWGFTYDYNEDIEFKFTSAHEIGHEILKSYGSTAYSYGHKGSVHVVTQSMKDNAGSYSTSGEIDIMPYYPNDPPLAVYDKYAAAEKDVLGLIWLTKIKIK